MAAHGEQERAAVSTPALHATCPSDHETTLKSFYSFSSASRAFCCLPEKAAAQIIPTGRPQQTVQLHRPHSREEATQRTGRAEGS